MINDNEDYDIYLFDDNENTQARVIQTLCDVLDYNLELSMKLINEVELKGKALIDIFDKETAIKKRDLLISFGLNCGICKSRK